MELVLDVKLDMKEQFVQQVFWVRFLIYKQLSILFSLLCRLIVWKCFCKKDCTLMLTESLRRHFAIGLRPLSSDVCCPLSTFPKNKWTILYQNLYLEYNALLGAKTKNKKNHDHHLTGSYFFR